LRIFLALAAVAAILFGMFAAMNIRSDIQVIVAVLSFASAIIFIGLATLISAVERLDRRIDALDGNDER